MELPAWLVYSGALAALLAAAFGILARVRGWGVDWVRRVTTETEDVEPKADDLAEITERFITETLTSVRDHVVEQFELFKGEMRTETVAIRAELANIERLEAKIENGLTHRTVRLEEKADRLEEKVDSLGRGVARIEGSLGSGTP